MARHGGGLLHAEEREHGRRDVADPAARLNPSARVSVVHVEERHRIERVRGVRLARRRVTHQLAVAVIGRHDERPALLSDCTKHKVVDLGQSLDHASWEVRRVAAEVLGAEGSEDALALLRARLERESDATVREAIMMSLAGPFSGGAESA